MRHTTQPPMTAEEFIRWLDEQPDRLRYELIAGEPIVIESERAPHAVLKGEIFAGLRSSR